MTRARVEYTFRVEGEITLTDPDDFESGEVTSSQAMQDALGHTGLVVTDAEVIGHRSLSNQEES